MIIRKASKKELKDCRHGETHAIQVDVYVGAAASYVGTLKECEAMKQEMVKRGVWQS